MAASLPSRYADVPDRVPESLSDLHGPTAGTVPLPLHLSWSGAGRYDVTQLRRLLHPGYVRPWEERFPELVAAAEAAEPELQEEIRRARRAAQEGLPI